MLAEPDSDDENDKASKSEAKSPTTVATKHVVVNPEEVTTLCNWEEKVAWAPERKDLWKKREIVVNERTTEYTKIDELGNTQVLIESEKTQYEVLHMENKEGEFAHRETNTHEQYEKFNDELVMHEKGNDNLVHLKSHEDEVSHHWTEGTTRVDPSAPPPPFRLLLPSLSAHCGVFVCAPLSHRVAPCFSPRRDAEPRTRGRWAPRDCRVRPERCFSTGER
jgi:hypothetical protein